MRAPTSFVLVHGAWHGGWCYSRVVKILRDAGHHVYTPTLTGLGERSHLTAMTINCSTHIEDVLNVIHWEGLERVVLCGHSYGGVVVGGVADRMPDRVDALVYLDGVIPESGKSIFDLVRPEAAVALLNRSAEYGGQFLSPEPATTLGVRSADRQIVDTLCTPQPIATFTEKVKLTGAFRTVRKKTYVLTTGWKNPARSLFYDGIKSDLSWEKHEVHCGHDVMLDEPERLAQILLEVI